MARFLGFSNGSAPLDLSTYTPIKATCSGTAGATSLTATGSFVAGQRIFICQMRGTGAGQYEDNYVGSYTSGTITTVLPLEYDYGDSGANQAQVVVVPEASSVTGTLTVPAWDGDVGGLSVIACSGTFSGIIDVSGKGFRGGAGRAGAGNVFAYCGEGTGGASAINASEAANGNGAGSSKAGSNVNHGNGGAGGGNGAAGVQGGNYSDAPLGAGGLEVGDVAISTIFMGGGGSGGVNNSGSPVTNGANGGGIIVVYAQSISATASLLANGASASGAVNNGYACGGGGAGGTILLRTSDISIGTDLIQAAAGIGGKGDTLKLGGNGSVGRIRVEACSASGTTSPTASSVVGGHDFCSSLAFIY